MAVSGCRGKIVEARRACKIETNHRAHHRCIPRNDRQLAVRIYALCRVFEFPATPILKSSILRPDLMAATNQRGCFPRPDHVSDGDDRLRYFGKTLGYLRRGSPSTLRAARSVSCPTATLPLLR